LIVNFIVALIIEDHISNIGQLADIKHRQIKDWIDTDSPIRRSYLCYCNWQQYLIRYYF